VEGTPIFRLIISFAMSIEVSNISKRFGPQVAALDKVSLKVPTGGLTALLGPSGSGKTTLLRIIGGLESPEPGSGPILFHGEDVSGIPVDKRGVGFVFQHYALFRHLSVFENIAFGLRVRKRADRPPEEEIHRRVTRLLQLVQLDGYEKRLPSQLSGGQCQRIALARALAVEPKVLLLDEPFGALDAKVRKELRHWLRHFHDETRLTTVFVTHDQEEALEIADEVVVMNKGHIEQRGSPDLVYDQPSSPFVYEFLGNVNRFTLPVRGFSSLDSVSQNSSGIAYVRPHDVDVVPATWTKEGEDALLVSVNAAGPIAHLSCRRVHCKDEIVDAEMSRELYRERNLHPGLAVKLRLRHSRQFAEDFSI
jgi:sulfate transport system ATP-binding protein